jgi:6,7-dimethyl-8-ribityllumazine synthase
MTSSDRTALSADAESRWAGCVGASFAGRCAGPARVAVLCAKFNGGISERLLAGVIQGLAEAGVDAPAVTLAWVPGAFELPLAAQRLLSADRFDAAIALGAVIRGETPHFDFVADQCASGLQRVALDTGIPVVFGVLTTDTVDQALARCVPGPQNKGYEAAATALEMVDLLATVSSARA